MGARQMSNEELYKNWERSQRALGVLPWDVIKNIRNANGKLYPLDWNKVCEKVQEKYGWNIDDKYDLNSKEDFEEKLKEVCDSLYDWKLYEPCPKCGKGLRIPIWSFTQWTAFCGCSEYPKCNFSEDREGKPIYQESEV